MSLLRRLFGFRYVRTIDKVRFLEASEWGIGFQVEQEHWSWERVRPWWKVWA